MKFRAPIRTAVSFAGSLALTACASYDTNYVANNTVLRDPVDGRVLTAQVGDTVARQGRYTTTPAIRVDSETRVGVLGENRILTGYYVKVGEDRESEFFQPEQSPNGGKLAKAAIADPIKALQAYKSQGRLCTVSAFNFHDCKDNAAFTRVERLVLSPDSQQQHLVYAGRRGEKLTFGYVETANLLARPAADARFEHDLSMSKIVSYQGMSIEIVDASDNILRYRIVAAPVSAG